MLERATATSPETDQRVELHLDWAAFTALLTARGESSATRLTYLDGKLEIISPSSSHEVLKTRIGRLLEAWAEEFDVELDGFGSWTVMNKRRKVAAEPDECYLVGHRAPGKRPDLAIEVNWSSIGIDKLSAWDRLEVPEVWIWESGRLTVYRRAKQGGYSVAKKSKLLPTLDIGLLAQFVEIPNQLVAVKSYRAALRRQ
jgi:Uma2 family endonuclease